MKALQKSLLIVGAVALTLASAPLTQASSAPRHTAKWIQENANRVANGRARVQVSKVESLGVRADGEQESFRVSTWADGEDGGTIILLLHPRRSKSFVRKFGTEIELDSRGNVKTKRLDAVARLNPGTGDIVLIWN